MNRSVTALSVVVLLATGCGAQLAQSPYAHGVTDDDRYAAALDEAFDRYDAEVAAAERMEFATEAEAQAVARTLAPRRFDVLLAASLQARGLSRRGLNVHAAHHPGFASAQEARFSGRLAGIEQRASALVTHVDASLAQVHPDLVDGPEQVAQR